MDGVNEDKLTRIIIGCALKVHQKLGPGLLESIYEKALKIEIDHAGLICETQKLLPVLYDDVVIGRQRLDMLVENQVVLEIKSVERFDSVFQAQLLSYMKLGGYETGLLINFNTRLLKQGIKRMSL